MELFCTFGSGESQVFDISSEETVQDLRRRAAAHIDVDDTRVHLSLPHATPFPPADNTPLADLPLTNGDTVTLSQRFCTVPAPHTYPCGLHITALTFTPDARHIVCGTQGAIIAVYDTTSGDSLSSTPTPLGCIHSVIAEGDGSIYYVSKRGLGRLENGVNTTLYSGATRSVSVASEGRVVLATPCGMRVLTHDGQLCFERSARQPLVAVSCDGEKVAVVDERVRVVSVLGEELLVGEEVVPSACVWGGGHLLVAVAGEVRFYAALTLVCERRFLCEGRAERLSMSPCGGWLFALCRTPGAVEATFHQYSLASGAAVLSVACGAQHCVSPCASVLLFRPLLTPMQVKTCPLLR